MKLSALDRDMAARRLDPALGHGTRHASAHAQLQPAVASVHAILADADLSPNSRRQSGGVMVNYLYDPDQISQNHERLAGRGRIAASSGVRSLAASADKTE